MTPKAPPVAWHDDNPGACFVAGTQVATGFNPDGSLVTRSIEDVQVGDLVQETDGSWQAVLASTREDHPDGITVYNLEVEGDHTYFVEDGFGGVDAVWVHNVCGDNDILQTGDHTIRSGTAKKLADKYDRHPKDYNRAMHALKNDLGILPSVHGKIRGDGEYLTEVNGVWVERGNLNDYLD